MVKRGNLVRVRGHYRRQNGKRVYVQPYTRWAPEGKEPKKMFKHKKQLTKEEEISSLNEDEIEIGDELAFKQGYKRRSIKTSEVLYGYDPKEMEEYPIRKKALLSLEEKQLLERKNIEKGKKDIEIGWKLTGKGKKYFSDSYYEGIDVKEEDKESE